MTKIFISWSKPISKSIAEELKFFLRQVHQEFEFFLSNHNIPHGSLWAQEIENNLKDSKAGIICVTPDNINSPWLNYEAGRLSNSNRVYVLLFGVTIQDLRDSPLSLFQTTEFNKESIYWMLKGINDDLRSSPLESDVLENSFKMFWEDFDKKIVPKLGQLKKKIGWVFSKSKIDVSLESNLLEEKGYVFLPSLILPEIAKTDLTNYDLLIFYHNNSVEDHQAIKDVIDYLEVTYNTQIPIILYIESRLPDDLHKECSRYKFVAANSPGKIVDNAEKYLS